jgi:hypothetical protein
MPAVAQISGDEVLHEVHTRLHGAAHDVGGQLVFHVGYEQRQLQRLVAAEGRANQSALLAAQPEQQLHFVVDCLRTGLRREAIRLVRATF